MSFLTDFKKFALRGNLTDMAIGFTVGAAFTTVAKSLVNDIIMPPVGLMMGGADFSNLMWVIREGDSVKAPYETPAVADAAGAVTINYGEFLNSCLSLTVVAIVMFILMRLFNRVDDALDQQFGDEEKPKETEPTEKKCPHCRTKIAYRATKCPHCTSELDTVPELTEARVAAQASTA